MSARHHRPGPIWRFQMRSMSSPPRAPSSVPAPGCRSESPGPCMATLMAGRSTSITASAGRAGDQGRPCGRLRPLRPASDTMVTGMSALPSTAGRDEASPPGRAAGISEAGISRRVSVAFPSGRIDVLLRAISATGTLVIEPVLGSPATPWAPYPPKRRPDLVQHGSPPSLPPRGGRCGSRVGWAYCPDRWFRGRGLLRMSLASRRGCVCATRRRQGRLRLAARRFLPSGFLPG
jgi:hypothetical protein